MKYKLIINFLALTLSLSLFSQISADRPDQTEGTYVLKKGNAQIETGWTFEENGYLNTLLRFGVFKGLELRVNTNLISSAGDMMGLFPEIGDLELGAKFRLLNNNSRTKISFASNLSIPVGDYGEDGILNSLLVSHDLSDTFQVAYNIGYDKYFENQQRRGENSVFVYSLVISKSFGRLGAFIEVFGEDGAEESDSSWDLGLTYLITDYLQADISYGNGINNGSSYLSIGAAWNFSLKSNK